MRIARIIEYFPPHIGGMEGHALVLSLEQIKKGQEVEVFIGYGGEWKTNFKGIPSDFPIYRMPLLLRRFLPLYTKIRRICFNLWAYYKVKERNKEKRFDIIHLHGDFVEAYFGGKLSKKLNIPAVLTIHAGLNKRLLKPENAKCFSNITKIICVSEEIANDLKSIGVSREKIAPIISSGPSGIYLAKFERINVNQGNITELQKKYPGIIIISVGVLRPAKGFKYLIEAFRPIKEKFDKTNLLIIGGGPDRAELEKQAEKIGNIHFLGRQEQGKVVEYLKAADIFALASIFMEGDREGMPTSIMEAMAAGLPVVATKVGGIPDLVKDSVNGFLVEPGDSQALANVIIKLVNDGELRRKMGEKNLEDIKQKDWPVIASLVNKVYESVL